MQEEILKWQRDIAVVALNLREIKTVFSNKFDNCTGQTKAKIEEANAIWSNLVKDFGMLETIVQEAAEIQKKNAAKAKALLEGESLTVQGKSISLSERSLISRANEEIRLTPAKMLDRMAERFNILKSTVDEIQKVMHSNEESFKSILQELSMLKSLEDADLVKSELPSVLTVDKTDPLRCSIQLQLAQAQIQDCNQMLRQLRSQHIEINSNINNIKNMLQEIQLLSIRSNSAIEQIKKEICNFPSLRLPINAEEFYKLTAWLTRLEELMKLKKNAPALIGLKNLYLQCQIQLEAEQKKFEQIQAVLDEKDYLSGEFSALNAKVSVLKSRGYFNETDDFIRLKKQLKQALDKTPFNILEARHLMEQFEISIRINERGA